MGRGQTVGGLLGHHEELDYIPHVVGWYRRVLSSAKTLAYGPLESALWPPCKEGNCKAVSLHWHEVWVCAHMYPILHTHQAGSDSGRTWPCFLE